MLRAFFEAYYWHDVCLFFGIKSLNNHSNFQLLEMLMNNIGDPVHKQVVDTGTLPVLVKIVKKKVYIQSMVLKCCFIFLFSTCCFPFANFFFILLFIVWPTCSGENISSVRCCTDICWWSFREISSILFCLLWIGGRYWKCLMYK